MDTEGGGSGILFLLVGNGLTWTVMNAWVCVRVIMLFCYAVLFVELVSPYKKKFSKADVCIHCFLLNSKSMYLDRN